MCGSGSGPLQLSWEVVSSPFRSGEEALGSRRKNVLTSIIRPDESFPRSSY